MFELNLLLHLSLFAVGACAILFAFRRSRSECNTILAAYTIAYLTRIAATLALHFYSHDGLFFLDDRSYDQQAGVLALSPFMNLSLLQSELGGLHIGYPLLVSLVYKFAGHSVLSAELLNAFFGAATVPIAYCLALEVTNDRLMARIVLWTSALFLYDIVWSAFLLKDTALLLLVTAACLCAARAIRRQSLVWLALFASLVLVVYLFRFYAANALVLAFMVAAVARLAQHSKFLNHRWPVFIVLSLALTAAGWRAFSWLGSHTVLGDEVSIRQIDNLIVAGGSEPLVFAPSAAFVGRIVMTGLYYFLAPFPWIFWGSVDQADQLPLYPGMYLIYALFPFFVAGLWHFIRRLDPAAIFIVTVILLHAGVEMYVFLGAPRQRLMTDVLFVICAATGWRLRRTTPVLVRAVYAALVVVICVRLGTDMAGWHY